MRRTENVFYHIVFSLSLFYAFILHWGHQKMIQSLQNQLFRGNITKDFNLVDS